MAHFFFWLEQFSTAGAGTVCYSLAYSALLFFRFLSLLNLAKKRRTSFFRWGGCVRGVMILIQSRGGGVLLYSLTANDLFIIRTIKQHTGAERERIYIYMLPLAVYHWSCAVLLQPSMTNIFRTPGMFLLSILFNTSGVERRRQAYNTHEKCWMWC